MAITNETNGNEIIASATLQEVYNLKNSQCPNKGNADIWAGEFADNAHKNRIAWFGIDKNCNAILEDPTFPAGFEYIKSARAELGLLEMPEPTSAKRVISFGVSGDELDDTRTGLPECWSSRRRKFTGGGSPVIRIAVQINANSGTKASKMVWNGAATAVLVDRLEDAGWRCEVTAYTKSIGQFVGKGFIAHCEVIIKDADDPLNLSVLSDTIGFPGFFRTFIFRLYLESKFYCDSGLGHSVVSDPFNAKDYHIVLKRSESLEEAAGNVRLQLQKFTNKK